jgi:hypothetical protein
VSLLGKEEIVNAAGPVRRREMPHVDLFRINFIPLF